MHIRVKSIILLHNARFLAKKLVRLIIAILVFYCIYYFSKKQSEFSKLLRKTDNRLMRFYRTIKKNTCKNIAINGVKYSNYRDIQYHINNYCSDKYKDLKSLEASIKNNVWIKDLKVMIKLPNRIVIDIIEHSPFALMTNNGINYKLIDEFGDFIDIGQDEIATFGYLLKIVGLDVKNYEINNLFNMLSIHHKIAKNIVSVVRIGDRRWDIVFSDNIIVKMPEENDNMYISEAWNILDNIVNIPEILLDLKEIDIRDQSKVYLKYDDRTFKKIIKPSI